MAQVNWTDYEEPTQNAGSLEPGIYTTIIIAAEERTSKNGDLYFNVTHESTQFQRVLCYDNIMLEGRGKNMGLAKLKTLGLLDKSEINDIDLVGVKCIVIVEDDSYEKADGKVIKRLGVALNFEDPFRAGYAPVEAYKELEADLVTAQDTPF